MSGGLRSVLAPPGAELALAVVLVLTLLVLLRYLTVVVYGLLLTLLPLHLLLFVVPWIDTAVPATFVVLTGAKKRVLLESVTVVVPVKGPFLPFVEVTGSSSTLRKQIELLASLACIVIAVLGRVEVLLPFVGLVVGTALDLIGSSIARTWSLTGRFELDLGSVSGRGALETLLLWAVWLLSPIILLEGVPLFLDRPVPVDRRELVPSLVVLIAGKVLIEGLTWDDRTELLAYWGVFGVALTGAPTTLPFVASGMGIGDALDIACDAAT